MEKVTTKRLAIYSGRTHPDLAAEVASHLNTELGQDNLVQFANGEVRCSFGESVRGTDVFVLQPTSTPVDEVMRGFLWERKVGEPA